MTNAEIFKSLPTPVLKNQINDIEKLISQLDKNKYRIMKIIKSRGKNETS